MAAVPTFSASHLVINSALGRPGGRGTHKGIGLQSAWFVLELGNYSLGFLWFFSAHFHPFPGFCMFFRPVELDFLFFLSQAASFCRIQSVSGWLVTVTTLLRCFKTPK